MRKLIDLDETTITKLKIISIFERMSVKALIENSVQSYVKNRELEKYKNLTDEEEDIEILILMQDSNKSALVSRNEIFETLN